MEYIDKQRYWKGKIVSKGIEKLLYLIEESFLNKNTESDEGHWTLDMSKDLTENL